MGSVTGAWRGVQARIGGRAGTRWVLLGAVAATLLAAAVVFARLPPGSDVDLRSDQAGPPAGDPVTPEPAGDPVTPEPAGEPAAGEQGPDGPGVSDEGAPDPGGPSASGADPGRNGPAVPAGLVATDGSGIVVTDLGGAVVAELDAPSDAADPLPIRRLAVRPGSTLDDLTVAFLRADGADGHGDVEMGWVRVEGTATTGGTLAEAPDVWIADPVWSPDGQSLWWLAGDVVHARRWGPGGPGDGVGDLVRQVTQICPAGHEGADTPCRLHMAATAPPRHSMPWWWARPGDGASDGVLTPPVGGSTLAILVQRHADGTIWPRTDLVSHSQMSAALDAATHHQDADQPTYQLGRGFMPNEIGPVLARATADAEPVPLSTPDEMTALHVDQGMTWLSALSDTVVFGVNDHDRADPRNLAWVVRWEGDGWGPLHALPAFVHADVVAAPAD